MQCNIYQQRTYISHTRYTREREIKRTVTFEAPHCAVGSSVEHFSVLRTQRGAAVRNHEKTIYNITYTTVRRVHAADINNTIIIVTL